MRDEKAWKWLNENELNYKIWNNKYRNDNESFDIWLDRVSNKNGEIRRLILEKKFLFGGRTLANRGTNKGSLNNCYSAGYVPDSLDGIMKTARDIAMTFKAQGGQGISLSKIRPKGSLIKGTFESDGIVPFMEIFNTVTASVSQGGHRRGALMMSLDINHPEAETFMTIKSDHGKINNANLSMEINDEFMIKVIGSDEEANRKFDLLCTQACKHAEPGVLFTNRLRNYNLMEHIDSYQIETTNPCGEQPLPKHGACGLCSINLSEYILDPFTNDAKFDIESFAHDIYYIVEAMDDIVQENLPNHALDEQRDVATRFRNLGIGVMGIQDMLIKLGLVYGSEKSLVSLNKIMKFVAQEAVLASAKLAETRGAFPEYSDAIFKSKFFKNLGLREECFPHGLRNSTLLSVAPTGSIGTMLNISSGVEPWFAMHYTRNTKSLEGKEMSHEVWAPIAEEAKKRNWHPETLVTSNDISWKEHIDVQAVVQAWVDTAVSKTINMPKGTTPEEVKQAYIYAWNKGLKGLTVYVDGSRDPILTTDNTSKEESTELHRGQIIKAGDNCIGLKRTLMTGCGTLHMSAFFDPITGDLLETYLSKGSQGGCNNFMIGLSRMMSLAARGGIKIESILDQLKSCGTCPSYAVRKATKRDVSLGSCCPTAVGNALKDMHKEVLQRIKCCNQEEIHIESQVEVDSKDKCPECGAKLEHTCGCNSCSSCGYSKCS